MYVLFNMGSPLGFLFANFYMTHVGYKVFQTKPNLKPSIFCRYVDECLLLLDYLENPERIITAFKKESVLNFTSELGFNNRLNIVDVAVSNVDGTLHTTTYTKAASPGIYLSLKGEGLLNISFIAPTKIHQI